MKLFLTFFLIVVNFASADELSESAKVEIEHLFHHLENSGCQFNRNGSWYSSVAASEHLRKKYNYLIKENLLSTAESFITKAATQSSSSGKAYGVKCAGRAVVVSAIWFNIELNTYRKTKN